MTDDPMDEFSGKQILPTHAMKVGIMEVLSEMEKLKVIRIGGTWHLSPVTPLQRSILEALGVPVPDDGSISRILSGGWRRRAPSARTRELFS